ncbi:MAG: LamB/YcsF family protein, partial [Desulfobacula sp.]|nr:LamB/YcsF family protein [Desulfobacula sp.]
MKVIDLNCDMGESFGAYKLGMDEEVMKHISSANIACGFHAGDPLVMDKTIKMAVDNKVGIG